MQHRYAWSWQSEDRHLIEPMGDDEARSAFEQGPQLGVVALADESPDEGAVPAYVLELNAQAEDVRVITYTPEGSVAAVTDYTVTGKDDRLFLEQVTEYLYPDDGDYHSRSESTAVRTFVFRPDGYSQLRSRVRAAGAETVEEFSGVDLTDHWIDPIGWGDWDRVGSYQPSHPTPG